MPGARDLFAYMRTVGRGSPVDAPWSVIGQLITTMRLGRGLAPSDSPRNLLDVMADPEYLDLRAPEIEVGDEAPDFALQAVDGGATVRLSELLGSRPVALVFGSYT
jgi:hypothetical protein